jgi:hypothetical protein
VILAAIDRLRSFAELWVVDFEFEAPPGEQPRPVCLVAMELQSGRWVKLWRGQFGPKPPYPIDARALFIGYFCSAECNAHLALGWPTPARILDLYTEFRALTNGRRTVAGNSLLGALLYHNLPAMAAAEKDAKRGLVTRGGPWSDSERTEILDYCAEDVLALSRLLPAMLPRIDLGRALLRGRFMSAIARMEAVGIPIDVPLLRRLQASWPTLKDLLISDIDRDYGVYDRSSFRAARFADYLTRAGIPWPRLASGKLQLDDETFKEIAETYPALEPLRTLRKTLVQLRPNELAVGGDGRSRGLLSPFQSKSGRNQPRSRQFIFGSPAWFRGLIRPAPGYGLAYLDWAQQEFGIAAALSGDRAMMEAYRSGDPYLALARQAGAVPKDATKASHGAVRKLFKTCALGVQYGMEFRTLARRLRQSEIVAKDLLRAHHESYPQFWLWSQASVDHALLTGEIHTVFGWPLHVGDGVNPRMLRNFPMQANGAEMMRVCACLATEDGIEVCAPVHDAFLIVAPLERLTEMTLAMQACMAEASRAVLSGFELRSDVMEIRYPARFRDPRGTAMWDQVMGLLAKVETEEYAHEEPEDQRSRADGF